MQKGWNGRIRWLAGEYAGRTCILPEGETYWIGSSGDCEIPLFGGNIAPYHLGITCGGERGGFYVLCPEPDSVFLEDGTSFPAGREQWIPSGTILVLGDGSNQICPEVDFQQGGLDAEWDEEDTGADQRSYAGWEDDSASDRQLETDWDDDSGEEQWGKRLHHDMIQKIALGMGIFCAIALIGVGVWKSGLLNRNRENGTLLAGLLEEIESEDTEKDTGNAAEQETTEYTPQPEKTIQYAENCVVYRPADEALAYDEDTYTIYYNNMLTVYLTEEITDEAKTALAESVGGEIVGEMSGAIDLVQIKVPETDLAQLNSYAESLKTAEHVMCATYEVPMMLSETGTYADQNPWADPTDDNYEEIVRLGREGNEDDPDGNNWWAEAIGAYTAWNCEFERQPITVAVIDNGFYLSNEDLQGKITMLNDNTADDHGTHVAGLIAATDNNVGIRGVADQAQILGIDWQDNDTGMTISICEFAALLKIAIENGTVYGPAQNGNTNGARVINLSIGATYPSDDSFYEEKESWPFNILPKANDITASEYATYILKTLPEQLHNNAKSVIRIMSNLALQGYQDYLIVQSAGNGIDNGGKSGVNSTYNGLVASVDYENVYKEVLNEYSDSVKALLGEKMGCSPLTQWSFGDFFEERILVVGSIRNEKENGYYKMATDSNYGDGVDLCAPGVDIYSTIGSYFSSEQVRNAKRWGINIKQYGNMNGTSMAAPLVSGAAALVWSVNPEWSVETVRALILGACEDWAIDEDQGGVNGKRYKVLNVGNAVEFAVALYKQEEEPETEASVVAIETESETAAPETTAPETAAAETDSQIVQTGLLPLDQPVRLDAVTGIHRWYLWLTLQADGTFTGESDEGTAALQGEGYSQTVYTMNFSGQFRNITQLNAYSWSMELCWSDSALERSAGEEWIEDGTLYISTDFSGFTDGASHTFFFYTPETPVSELDENFLESYRNTYGEPQETLGRYGIWCQDGGWGHFFSTGESS